MDDDDDDEDDDNDDDKPEDGHETSDKKKTAAPNEVDEEQPAETENNTDNNNNSDNNAVKATVAFASPEGEMNEFNDRVVDEPTETSSTAKADEKLHSPLAAEIAQQVEEAKAILDRAQAAAAAASRPENGNETDPAGETGNDNDNDSDKEQEEAFRRWQEHMRGEAGSEYMEQQVKSLSGCCSLCFQLILLCLIVAKLEADYSDVGETFEDEEDNDYGYNAFWVLFPIFLVAGILLLCCAGCIFAREDKTESNATAAATNAASGEDEPSPDTIIPPAPPGAIVPNAEESSQHDGSGGGNNNSSAMDSRTSHLGSSHHADPVLTEEGVEASNHSTMDDID